jgi:tetratricopeptide (TPR) repeat protein
MRERVPALTLFDGVVDEHVLAIFSQCDGVLTRFAGVAKEAWAKILQRLSAVDLLTPIGGGMYRLHLAVPSYVVGAWQRMAGDGYVLEHPASERALMAAYGVFGDWLLRQIQSGLNEIAVALMHYQWRTMARLLGLALDNRRYAQAQSLIQPLDAFWEMRGLHHEARRWLDRVRSMLESPDGTPPNLGSEEGALWLFVVTSEANRAIVAGDLKPAQSIYDSIRLRLQGSSVASREPRLAIVYHHLGRLSQHRGDLATAEDWHRRSLAIREMLGDRPGMASSHHQLGILAQLRGDLAAAEGWYRKSVAILEWLGNQPGMAGGYHQLGMVAQLRGDLAAAGDWYGKSLEIGEALGNRPGVALTYAQLGLLAEAKGDLAAAIDWAVRCVVLFSDFPHPATGTGPRDLVRLTHLVGMPTLESRWLHCTGTRLPRDVRSIVEHELRNEHHDSVR